MPGNMDNFGLIISLLILVMKHSSSNGDQTSNSSLDEHVKKIDEVLSEMQTHSKFQEESSRAMISSLLSQHTKTTHELEDLKKNQDELWASYNETIVKLEEKDTELSELWKSHNATVSELDQHVKKIDELLAGMQSHSKYQEQNFSSTLTSLLSQLTQNTDTVEELKSVANESMSKLNKLETCANPNGSIGLHGMITRGKNITANKPIIFDRILHNSGASYKYNSGTFPVPMNGTYQIWIDFKYRRADLACRFFIRRDNHIIDKVYGSPSGAHETSTAFTVTDLQKGQSIWVTPSLQVHLDNPFCNFGIALLNAH